MSSKIIKSARPNGHYVAIKEYTYKDGEKSYDVICHIRTFDGVDEDDRECEDLKEAEIIFADTVKEMSTVRNEVVQAEYDQVHGTDNGFSPWDFGREY